AFYVGGDFILVTKHEVFVVIEDPFARALAESDVAFHGHEHGGGARGGGLGSGGRRCDKQQRDGFDAEHSSAQNGVGTAVGGDDFVGRSGQELVDGGGGKALFDAVAGGFVFQGRDGNHVNGLGESVVMAGDVVTAPCDEPGSADNRRYWLPPARGQPRRNRRSLAAR